MQKRLVLLTLASLLIWSGCAAPDSSRPSTFNHGNRPVKIINGKRYVYVRGELGSNMPARWVPEDSPEAQNSGASQSVDRDTVQQFQGGGYR